MAGPDSSYMVVVVKKPANTNKSLRLDDELVVTRQLTKVVSGLVSEYGQKTTVVKMGIVQWYNPSDIMKRQKMNGRAWGKGPG